MGAQSTTDESKKLSLFVRITPGYAPATESKNVPLSKALKLNITSYHLQK
jgi:hypothetical protein